MKTHTASVIAMDWGSTMLRAYLLSDKGDLMAEKSFPWGYFNYLKVTEKR